MASFGLHIGWLVSYCVTGYLKLKSTVSQNQSDMENKHIIFVLGGPGSGKGTQCEKIVERYGFKHLSSGDLLREEVASGSPKGAELRKIMERGELVSLDTVLELIKTNIMSNQESKGFLIDGYPREIQQGIEFEKKIAPCLFVLWFDVAQETMKQRLLNRAKTSGRADDNEQTIQLRLKTFTESTEPVIEYYKKLNKIEQIHSEHDVTTVFESVQNIFEKHNLPSQ